MPSFKYLSWRVIRSGDLAESEPGTFATDPDGLESIRVGLITTVVGSELSSLSKLSKPHTVLQENKEPDE